MTSDGSDEAENVLRARFAARSWSSDSVKRTMSLLELKAFIKLSAIWCHATNSSDKDESSAQARKALATPCAVGSSSKAAESRFESEISLLRCSCRSVMYGALLLEAVEEEAVERRSKEEVVSLRRGGARGVSRRCKFCVRLCQQCARVW